MSLSFEDSLKKNNIEIASKKSENILMTTMANIADDSIDDIGIASNMAIADMGIMTLNETDGIAAYSGDDGDWVVHPDYDIFKYFSDENISTVNDEKDIVLNRKQYNITQEENSQYIPFEMNRYYDGFDLAGYNGSNSVTGESSTIISIHYQTKGGYHEGCKPVNVTFNNDKIRFGWLIGAGATSDVGTLEFEIQVWGTITSEKGTSMAYTWKTKRNKDLNVLESLCDCNDVINRIDETWMQKLITDVAERVAEEIKDVEVGEQVEAAQQAASDAQQAAKDALAYAESASTIATETVNLALKHYPTKDEMQNAINAADISDKLNDYVKTEDLEANYYNKTDADQNITDKLKDYATKDDVDGMITGADITGKLENYYTKSETYNKEEVDAALQNVDLTGYATETYVNTQVGNLSSSITKNTESIVSANAAIANINKTLESVDTSPNAYYITTYNQPYSLNGTDYTGENTLVLYRTDEKDSDGARTYVTHHEITGGSGGVTSGNTLKINRVTSSPYTVSSNDSIIIEYTFEGTNTSGVDIELGYATWMVGNKKIIDREPISTSVNMPDGKNSIDLTEYIGIGSNQKVTVYITDDANTPPQSMFWYVSVVDVKMSSNFKDTQYYVANSPVDFTFTPYGAVDKTVHFFLDGNEIGTKPSAKSAVGLLDSYTIPAQEHGSYLLEAYMTADINGKSIESNHIYKDILWYDSESDKPVIGINYQNFDDFNIEENVFTAKQYDATDIEYTVYDPSTAMPTVVITVDDNAMQPIVLDKPTNKYTFKTDIVGEHVITIACGDTVKTIKANVEKLNIDVKPVTTGLAFDFNPSGKSNNNADRLWTDGTVSMFVSPNFDWVNGGYQYDENGDQYFCVKSGTTATIDYNLFADDAKTQGKEFKVIFKTTNIKNRDTSFISCIDSGIGIDMKVQDANVYSSNGSLYSPYCEEDIIEFEFNINTNDYIPLVMTYEDGVACRPMIYTSDASFWQSTPQPITIGSTDCDVHIYRMKAYTRSLSDSEILSNFILDARNADEMVSRYNRNQIYDNKDGIKVLTPEGLAKACPDLRVIIVDAPWFTNDKDNKVDNTTVTMIYENGRPEDNWTCTGARHSGQGTSSNEYGYAGRNIDLIMDGDSSLFKWTDANGVEVESKTITLTETSVPTDYLNVKVNIASSENQNNAQMARRYNEYNPFVRSAKFNDNKIKDCMEFYNCVIFVRENNTDISTHREFQDTEYHFYGIGNVGDSKKTDDTRVNDKNDPRECVVEITDYNVPLAEFPTGNGNDICSPSDWKAGNTAYDILYAEYQYKDGKFKSFGSKSYEFRYEMKGITEEQREVNINAWRDMYKFVVTSTDEEFYNRLKEYFVVDSALYYYLFTERYIMVDNRAKNSFWHIGKVYITEDEATALGDKAGGFIVDNEQAAINDGYRWDLSFGYDFDTSLGIDNTGKLVLTYGKEDTDYYIDGDPSSSYIYRAAESTFFCRLRDLFTSELQTMFVDRENKNAWSATGLINQWDNAQAQFPEELWRLDIERKYLRTYLASSIDNSIVPKDENGNPVSQSRFLVEMLNGRKKYQRRMFERNQELYMATKYFGKTATQDQIMMRFNNPESYVVKPDFTLYITPYSDMYIGVSFYNGHKENFRAKAGVKYPVYYPEGLDTSDITLIYGASFIQAIDDLSKCYVGRNDFSKASRLQRLVIGSDIEGYSNSFMDSISLGNNKLLEYLDVRNITGLSSTIDLSQCGNMLELYAQGSGAKGVIFANGGKIQKFYLPAITSLTAKNLNYIEDFNIESYINLQTLVVENTPAIDTHEIVDTTFEIQSFLPIDSSKLTVLRLIGIDWNIDSADILDDIILLRGQNSDGGETSQSVLTGVVSVPQIGQYDLNRYKQTWSDLTINVPESGLIPQYKVTFVNHDGTELNVQYIDQYENAIDPTNPEYENYIGTPTKESTVQYSYKFDGWDKTFVNVQSDLIVTAKYTEEIRKYTVRYEMGEPSRGTVIKTYTDIPYGNNAVYDGDIPKYTYAEPTVYYLFKGWDKSGIADGDFDENGVKVINATWDTFQSVKGFNNADGTRKKLEDLSPVEVYALIGLSKSGKINIGSNFGQESESYTGFIADGDKYSFALGHDFDYSDVPSVEIIGKNSEFGDEYKSPIEFVRNSDGTGTYFDTGIQLFNEDKDFVLAIDYEFTGDTANSVLAQCCRVRTNGGFKLLYVEKDGAYLKWTSNSTKQRIASLNKREMVIIRHKKGEPNLTIYSSNLDSQDIYTEEIDGIEFSVTESDTLVFGCEKQSATVFANYASGKINWAKVWYKDIGDDACKELASWTHEDIDLQACGFDRYYLANATNDETCSFSLLATHLLERVKRWNPSDTGNIGTGNIGGWAESELNKYLNKRLYDSLPVQIKSLIKQVEICSSSGDSSTELSYSNCYISIPAVIELNPTIDSNTSQYNATPYTGEGTAISYISKLELRQRGFRDEGNSVKYWTRSPYVYTSLPHTSSGSYVVCVDDKGSYSSINGTSNEFGVLIMISF